MGTRPVAGDLLHYECGMHRGSSPTTVGADIDKFEREYRAHLAGGPCAINAQAKARASHPGDDTCQSCGQAAIYHGAG